MIVWVAKAADLEAIVVVSRWYTTVWCLGLTSKTNTIRTLPVPSTSLAIGLHESILGHLRLMIGFRRFSFMKRLGPTGSGITKLTGTPASASYAFLQAAVNLRTIGLPWL
jgi:hypothetical protein